MKRRYIRLDAALEITGHDTVCALTYWIKRWNLDNPDDIILRPYGKVEVSSLKHAWEKDVIRRTPGARRIQATNHTLAGQRR